jgi:protein-arginine kinase activator protein McsA
MGDNEKTLTLEQVEAMIEMVKETINDHAGRAERRAFSEKKLSKRARIAALEQDVELLTVMVHTLMAEKLAAIRDAIREGKVHQDNMDSLAAVLRLTTFKPGKG